MTTSTDNKVPAEQLLSAIEKTLQSAPRLVDQLAHELGCSGSMVRLRLERLEAEGRAHRVRVRLENYQGKCYLWHYGPAPGALTVAVIQLAQELPRADLRVHVPHQAIVSSWPAFRQRDWSVAALFGSIQQAAA